MNAPSPFRAGFGKVPPVLAGRSEILKGFTDAIQAGSWGTERAVLLRGFRGVGKTVTLETLRRIAEDSGWVTIDETASPGFLDRMLKKLRKAVQDRKPAGTTRLKSVEIAAVGGVELEHIDSAAIDPTLESLLEELAELVEPDGGVLFTLDEVSQTTIGEFQSFVGALQRSISRDREVAVVLAGLHSDIAAILQEGTATFLRRAHNENLDLLDYASTLEALRDPITSHGRTIAAGALDYAAAASQGYPFLTQLIGDLAWRQHADEREITLADVKTASKKAKRRIGASIHEPSIAHLRPFDRTVLVAMAQDDGPSKVGDLRPRLDDASKQHLNNARARLLDAGIVFTPKRGELDFALPYLRDYLREHTVTDAMGASSRDIADARSKFPPPPEDL
ncbi:ATP-binding protein [Agromyces sp. NPDC057679]|uniref:ATP-binding protein n=1 Tax=Agromyces sp. NPDC057679 TaxID=3346207 RepID=UPI00366C3145